MKCECVDDNIKDITNSRFLILQKQNLQKVQLIWKMYTGMERIGMVAVAVYMALFFPMVQAEEVITEVSLRFSEHDEYTRVVFEAGSEPFIENASVTTSGRAILVRFPSGFTLRTPGNFPFQTAVRGKTFTINVTHPFRLKVLRLYSPSRLSIDILKTWNGEPKGETVGKPNGSVQRSHVMPPQAMPAIRTVMDPGHGGYDLGIMSDDVREKDITLFFAKGIETALLKKGRSVFLTRRSDQFLSISERAMFANQKSPDVFISLHLSTSDHFTVYVPVADPGGPELSVYELYGTLSRQRRFVEKSRALGEEIGKSIFESFKTEVVQQEMSLPLLESVGAASVMVEVPRTASYDQAVRGRFSEAILKAVSSYANR
jgi:N-acetylmuramoyl-L-alanine amidase